MADNLEDWDWTTADIERLIAERDHVLRKVPVCYCGSDQVQLLDWSRARNWIAWRCRRCRAHIATESAFDDMPPAPAQEGKG